MLASERGHRDIVDALLSAGADVCGLDENGNSALHLACFYGNHNVVELLLTVDVDLTVRFDVVFVSRVLFLAFLVQ